MDADNRSRASLDKLNDWLEAEADRRTKDRITGTVRVEIAWEHGRVRSIKVDPQEFLTGDKSGG